MKEFAFIHEHGQVPDSLRSVPFLGSFSEEQLDDVLNSSSYIQCEIGDPIIQEGAVDSRIYILLSGAMDVCKDGKTLATISRTGEVFGELARVNEDKRSATVVASKPSVCLAVDQKFLQDIKPREEYPAFYASLYEFIARVTATRLQATSRRLSELELEVKALRAQLAEKDGTADTEDLTPVIATAPAAKAVIAKAKPATRTTRRPVAKRKALVKAKAKSRR
ncbi:MAG: cyclic nucleotide-binding domain-containing protein [Verrucomicrobium sp.]